MGPKILLSGAPVGVACDGFGCGNYAGPIADCGDASSARPTSGIKRGKYVEGRAAIGNGVRGSVGSDGRGGPEDGDVIIGGRGVADGGGARAPTSSMEATEAIRTAPLTEAVP